MGRNSKFAAVVSAVFLVIIFIMFRGTGEGRILFGTDTIGIYHAFRVFAERLFGQSGAMPVWMPHIFLGVPLIASSSLLYFYPTDFIFLFLPGAPEATYTIDIIIHMAAAAAGVFLFLRRIPVGRNAALFAASAIMVSGYLISYIYVGHWNNIKAGALIPFVFYFTHRAITEKKFFYAASAGLIMAFQVLATGMQVMAYTFIGAGLYAAYYLVFEEKNKKARIKTAAVILAASLAAVLLSAAQFLPSLEYKDYSWRGDFSYGHFISWSLHPLEAITFLLPGLFGLYGKTYFGSMPFNLTTYYLGLIPFLLTPFAFLPGKNRKFSLFAGAAALLFLVLSFGGFTPLYRLLYHIPVLNQFRVPSRYLYVFTFFIIALAAIGLNNIFSAEKDKDYKKSVYYRLWKREFLILGGVYLVFFLALAAGGAGGIVEAASGMLRGRAVDAGLKRQAAEMIRGDIAWFIGVSFLFAITIFAVITGRLKNYLAAAMVLLVINFADAYRIDKNFIRYDDYNTIINPNNPITAFFDSRRGIYRVAGLDRAAGPNKGIYYDIETTGGNHGLAPARTMKMKKAGFFSRLDINRIFNVKYYVSQNALNAPGLVKVNSPGINIYKDSGALDRAYFAGRVIKLGSSKEVFDYMESTYMDNDTALVTEDTGITGAGAGGRSFVEIYDYTPSRVRVKCITENEGILVLSNLYYDNWKVEIDGKPEKIYNVNYAAMGVKVKKGEHNIKFYYDSGKITAGLIIMLAAFILYAGLYFFEIIIPRRKRREK